MPINRGFEEEGEGGEDRNANLKLKEELFSGHLLSHFDGLVVSSHDGKPSKRTAAL